MQRATQIHLSDVQAAHSSPEHQLWELLMGEQIHLGGLQSSLDLAERAGLQEGLTGVDLCCASGAGMRFLLRCRKVARMTRVDATPAMISLGQQRSLEQGVGERIEKQLGYDSLRSRGFASAPAGVILEEMRFLGAPAKAGRIIPGLIVAQKAP